MDTEQIKTIKLNSSLPQDNDIEMFYQNKLSEFFYYQSENVTDMDGNPIKKGFDRFLFSQHVISGGNKTITYTADRKTVSGFDLTEKEFVEKELLNITTKFNEIKEFLILNNTDIKKRAEMYIDYLSKRLLSIQNNDDKNQPQKIQLPEVLIKWLNETICDNNKPYIEKYGDKWKLLQNKQIARKLFTHEYVRGEMGINEAIEKYQSLFIDKYNNPLKIGNNDKRAENSRDFCRMMNKLDELNKKTDLLK